MFCCFFSLTSDISKKNYSTKKGVKYPFKVRFRSFKSLNIKMSHSVVQKNHLPSEFMSIYSWVMAKLLFFIFVKHPVYSNKNLVSTFINKNTIILMSNQFYDWWCIYEILKSLLMLYRQHSGQPTTLVGLLKLKSIQV